MESEAMTNFVDLDSKWRTDRHRDEKERGFRARPDSIMRFWRESCSGESSGREI